MWKIHTYPFNPLVTKGIVWQSALVGMHLMVMDITLDFKLDYLHKKMKVLTFVLLFPKSSHAIKPIIRSMQI